MLKLHSFRKQFAMQKNNFIYLWVITVIVVTGFTTYSLLNNNNPKLKGESEAMENIDWSKAEKKENEIEYKYSYRTDQADAFQVSGRPAFAQSYFYEEYSAGLCQVNNNNYEIITDLYTFPTSKAKVINYVIRNNYSSNSQSSFTPWSSNNFCKGQNQIVKTVIEVNGSQVDEIEIEKINNPNGSSKKYNPDLSLETKVLVAIKNDGIVALRYTNSKINIAKNRISGNKSSVTDKNYVERTDININKKPDQDILAIQNNQNWVKIDFKKIKTQSIKNPKVVENVVSETTARYEENYKPTYTASSSYEAFISQFLYKIEWQWDLWKNFDVYLADINLSDTGDEVNLFFRDLSQCKPDQSKDSYISRLTQNSCYKMLMFKKQSNGDWLATTQENLPNLLVPDSIIELKTLGWEDYGSQSLNAINSEQSKIMDIKRSDYNKIQDLKSLDLEPNQTEYIGNITYKGGTNIGKNIRTIPDGLIVKGNIDLDSVGSFTIGKNAIIQGSVKLQSSQLVIEDGATISGDIIINGGSLKVGNSVTINGETSVSSGTIKMDSQNVMNKVSVNSGYIEMGNNNKIESLNLDYPSSLKQSGKNSILIIKYQESNR